VGHYTVWSLEGAYALRRNYGLHRAQAQGGYSPSTDSESDTGSPFKRTFNARGDGAPVLPRH